MTEPTPPRRARTPRTRRAPAEAPGCSGLHALSDLGEEVDLTSSRTFVLDSPRSVWIVDEGLIDVFAAAPAHGEAAGGHGGVVPPGVSSETDEDGRFGRWHFMCRVGAGTILLGSPPGPRHVLVAKPLPGGRARKIGLGELHHAQTVHWTDDPTEFGRPGRVFGENQALAAGLEAGIEAMHNGVRTGLPPRTFTPLEPGSGLELSEGTPARSIGGVLWVQVVSGWIRLGGPAVDRAYQFGDQLAIGDTYWLESSDGTATVFPRTTADLIADGSLWQSLLRHQVRFLYAVDRFIEQRDLTTRSELAARQQSNAEAIARSSRALAAVLAPLPAGITPDDAGDEDRYAAVARLVARSAGVTVTRTHTAETADSRLDPLERIAVSSGFRTRTVRLSGRWWRTDIGPLVGRESDGGKPVALLWHHGRYDIYDEQTGKRTPVTGKTAASLAAEATGMYRPLPERPVTGLGLLRFGLRGQRGDLTRLVAGGLVAALLGLLVPILTGTILGQLVPEAARSLIVDLCVVLIISGLVSAVFTGMQNLAMLRVEGRFDLDVQAAVWDRLLRLPAAFFGRYSTGQLSNAALGISAIREAASGVTVQAVLGSIVVLVNLGLLFFYSPLLALLAGGLVLIAVVVCLVAGVRQVHGQRALMAMENDLSGKLFQMLNGLSKLRVAAAEDRAFAYWATDFAKARATSAGARRVQNAVVTFNAGYTLIATLIIFAMVAGPAKGQLSEAGFLSFNAAYGIMMSGALQFTAAITTAVAIVPMFEGVQPVVSQVPEVAAAQESPGDLSGDIEVSQVSFAYAEGGPVILDEVSFHVRPGEFLAIVGPTGCGKSTLLRLLIGFARPSSGSLLYDAQDLSSLDVTAVRRQCGVVLQNGQLFAGSILSNICGAGSFTLDEAWEAAEMAGLDADIALMPMGMHTVLSEGALTLSAGQRQRLMIARSLISRPRILFFDEATSALDNRTQEIVTESMRRLRATRVVIAHRLSTIMNADRVLVLDAGRVVESGTPAELLDRPDGTFHNLVRRQVA
jgi:NHLM bacteriocin system ABC transporter ATP-binding protein